METLDLRQGRLIERHAVVPVGGLRRGLETRRAGLTRPRFAQLSRYTETLLEKRDAVNEKYLAQ